MVMVLFSHAKKAFKHWDEHLDVHPDVHLDVQFIINLWLSCLDFLLKLSLRLALVHGWLFPELSHQETPEFFDKMVRLENVHQEPLMGKVQGETRIGATGLRASEREICLWEGLWEGGFSECFQRFLLGGWRFTLKFRGRLWKKHCKTRGFGQPMPPKFRGWICTP